MKKRFVLTLVCLPAFLVSCGTSVPTASSASTNASASASTSENVNTIASVMASFGENITINAAFSFLGQGGSAVPIINTAYTKEGCYFKYTNFGTAYTSFGLINIAAGAKAGVSEGTYKWTEENKALVLGDQVSSNPSFQTLYDTPALVGENSAMFASAFVPEIAGTTSGYFDLNKNPNVDVSSSSGAVASSSSAFVDQSENLAKMAKYLGIYDALTSIDGLSLDYARLYFSEKGTSYRFTFYSKFQGGFNGLECIVAVSKIGTTTIPDITAYLAA